MTMNLERDARNHIESIRLKHSTEGHEELAAIVRSALEILATELYDTSTHFLLELLQNADDNDYTCSTPTFSLTYAPGGLRVDCNETGFTASNVEAICTIRSSTKSRKNHSRGYTGEKGIGFKSVFRVADVVWISSREYHFKFDKTEEFGTIAPRWEEFPGPQLADQTSFYFQLSREYNENELVNELYTFDPAIIIFLRKLKDVVLQVTRANGEVWRQRIYRTDTCENGDSLRILDLGEKQLRYLTWTHRFEGLPKEPRRPNYSHSELILAFPITDFSSELQPERQNVYASLPISDYGLKFLLHGDFLLSANRLHIDTSLPWNHALRDALADAFIEAVNNFNKGPMKYLWPHFMPNTSTYSFFQPARESILRALAATAVLESAAGTMANPSQLVYVDPTNFADENGRLFTSGLHTADRYLSANYPSRMIESVCSLGVHTLSSNEFIQDLASMISRDSANFQNRSFEWHTQLARALVPLTEEPAHKTALSAISIIPLSCGEWTSAAKYPLLLSGGFDLPDFPVWSEILIVDPIAAADKDRRSLFERLGVMRVERLDMCHIIARAHISPSFEPKQWTRAQLISHERFLRDSSWQTPSDIDLWFATSDDNRCKGSKLYIKGKLERDSPAARVFHKLQERFSVIHDNYFSGLNPESQKRCLLYLVKNLHLSEIPRLVSTSKVGSNQIFRLSDEFKFMFQECRISDVLHVLIENWHSYSEWIELNSFQRRNPESVASRNRLINMIGDTLVRTNIGPVPLGDTVLAAVNSRVEELGIPLPILDVDNPMDKLLQQRLSTFGVTVDSNIDYLLICLKSLQEHRIFPDFDTISAVYELIQSQYDDNEDATEKAFMENNFIYVGSITSKAGNSNRWISISECVTRMIDLEVVYPSSKRLFRCLLDIGSHDIASLVTKAAVINSSSKLQDISQLFKEINKELQAISHARVSQAIKPLQRKSIFPVTKIKTESLNSWSLSPHDTSWFIADRSHLRESFAGKVPLLAFGVKDLDDMEDLLIALHLDSRRLSKLCERKTNPTGSIRLSVQDTWFFQTRIPFIKVLISKTHPKRDELCRRIDSTEVCTASEITHSYIMRYNDLERTGNPVKGEVAISPMGDRLMLFISQQGLIRRHSSFELVDLIARHFEIKDPVHLRLLFAALSEPSAQRTQAIFALEGFNVNISVKDVSNKGAPVRYHARMGDLLKVPSPFTYPDSDSDDAEIGDRRTGMWGRYEYGGRRDHVQRRRNGTGNDRRLPLMEIMDLDMELLTNYLNPLGAFFIGEELDPHQHLEYIGQSLTSQFFKERLGDSYDPVKHWTSRLRARAGHPCSRGYESMSPFTMGSQHVSEAVTEFLSKNGHSEVDHWRNTRPTYHFEVAVSVGDANSSFVWSSLEYERMRKSYSYTQDEAPKNAMVLIRISNVYTQPVFRIVANPGSLFTCRCLTMQGTTKFQVAIRESGAIPSPSIFKRKGGPSTAEGDTPRKEPKQFRHQGPTSATPNKEHTCQDQQLEAQAVFGNIHDNGTTQLHRTHNTAANRLHHGFATRSIIRQGGSWKGNVGPHPNHRHNELERRKCSTSVGSSFINLTGGEQLRYSYERLTGKQIRLFVLFPGKNAEMLHGSICILPFIEDAGSYRTLSYAWGEDTHSKHTLVTPEGTLRLKSSLYEALLRLRHEEATVVLWVDALCINQADETEKAGQIRLLPEIFQHATSTIAFIGADEKSDSALEMLLQVRAKTVYGSDLKDWPKKLPTIPSSWSDRNIPLLEDPIWVDVEAFFNRSWFRRAWIVQEAVAAPTVKVVCGKWMINWNDLLGAVEIIEREPQMPKLNPASWGAFVTLSHLREWEARHSRWTLLVLLETFRYVESSMKRDRFFALLGIASDGNRAEFEPDYRSDFRVIVCRFARALVAQGNGMQLLHRAGLSSQPDRFPSWVPDWTVPRPGGLNDSCDRGVVYNASGSLEKRIYCIPGSDVLAVQGYLVDEIAHVSKYSNEPKEREQYFKEIDTMIDSLSEFHTGDVRDRMKWQVPIGGAMYPKVATYDDFDLYDSYKAFRKGLKKAEHKIPKEQKHPPDKIVTSSNEGASVQQKSMNYISLLDDNIAGWKLVTTKRNLCGIVPHNVEVGDVVSIFGGGDVPFILRKSQVKGREVEFRLVGECYIGGIMHGEGLGFKDIVKGMLHIY
ncbi:hypothetical protein HD806DRAFT_517477 [Xylariaceae sp. AK1471]|nr:hypothetical protein HD806DRAFT_517477 [Xylariaceae sp. AK1471]